MMLFYSNDPVADAERYAAYQEKRATAWERENPEYEETVEYTVILQVVGKGRTEDEIRESADQKLKTLLDGAGYETVWEWDAVEARRGERL